MAAGAAGAGAGGFAATIASLSNPITATVGALVSLTVAGIGVEKALEKLASATMESSRDMARFSGAIAGTFAMLDRQELQLQARSAAATGTTAQSLGNNPMALRAATQPMNETLQNLGNLTGIAMAKVATGIAQLLQVVTVPMEWATKFFIDWFMDPASKQQLPWLEAMDTFAPRNKKPGENK